LRLGGRTIASTSLVNYLGVLLNPKLNLRQHLRARWKKIYSSLWACRKVMALGINPKIAIWMYQTSVATKTVCISGLLAHGEQGGSKEPTAKPTK
jgi:hypothetical protein